MGYYTEYKLDVLRNDNGVLKPLPYATAVQIIDDLRSGNPNAYYALTPQGDTRSDTKWHMHVDDMKAFSASHPDYIFKLMGRGEDWEDYPDKAWWTCYFVNGAWHENEFGKFLEE